MEQVLIVLVTLAGVTHAFFPASDTNCNATLNTSLCSVTLGGSVYVQVMTNASGHLLLCKKQLPTGSINVFTLKKEKVVIHGSFRNRTEFFISNGTLKITNVEWSDSGQYSVEVFDPDGVLLRNIYAELDVKENICHILIPVGCAVGALVIVVVILCCVCKSRRNKKSDSGK